MATANQPTVTLNDGVTMPQLGLGVWRTPAEDAETVVGEALDAGYRAVDTAAIYGNEEGVGRALAGRGDIFVTTKVWNSDQGRDATLRAFDKSAARLRRDVIDLYLIHWPVPRQDRYVETWQAMIELKRGGRVRSIGVSNFNPDHLERIVGETGVAPSVNQVEVHPDFQQRDIRAANARHGTVTESWSPLGQGTILKDPVLLAIAEKHGRSAAQVIIRWHLQQGLVVIPKSVTPARIRENIDVFGFTLDADDLALIEGLDRPDTRIGPDPVKTSF